MKTKYIFTDTKQDKLVSGVNIKTVDNNSVLGSGNVKVIRGVTTFVSATEPTEKQTNDIWIKI